MNLKHPHDLVILMRQETTVNYLRELEVRHLPRSAHLSPDLSAACSHSGVGCRDSQAGQSGREAGRACPHAGPLIAVLVPTSPRLLARRGTSRRLIALFKL